MADYSYICLDEVDSTSTYLKNHPENWSQFSTVHAIKQTAGRGRHGRTWFSPESMIAFSFSYFPKSSVNVTAITVCAGLALRNALVKITGSEILLKWPNDIFIKNKKAAGILTELITTPKKTPVILIGIGINRETGDLPDEIRENAIGIQEVESCEVRQFTNKEIIDTVIGAMEIYLPRYEFPLPAAIVQEFNANCLTGKRMVSISENGQMIKKIINVHGMDKYGNLLGEVNHQITPLKDAFEINNNETG